VLKPFDVARRWALRVTDEFFLQGDVEREFEMEVTPMCDRATQSRVALQTGFIKMVTPMCDGTTQSRVTPMCDRATQSRVALQTGFIKMVCTSLYESMAEVYPQAFRAPLLQMKANALL
ncbi:hypothetical protein T484DRAFT_1861651, partial [Baffinella frigidus]